MKQGEILFRYTRFLQSLIPREYLIAAVLDFSLLSPISDQIPSYPLFSIEGFPVWKRDLSLKFSFTSLTDFFLLLPV